ncbi:hypothetical protein PTMSG1_10375 [Pyrenophora teres f. maculata]|nr:hypothetical protein PTMSG1_10375 [Pyrenophora teres f. maculata]
MRSNLWLLATLGLADAWVLSPRQTRASPAPPSTTPWRPKTNHPEFFSLRVDVPTECSPDATTGSDNNIGDGNAADCTFVNYAIRLENGIAIATPYNQWWDPKLPIMFVDDDTKLYTVSKQPLEFYIDTAMGALRYAPVGWLPPNSISTSFYHTGNNPLGVVGPSTAFLSWPSTQGRLAAYNCTSEISSSTVRNGASHCKLYAATDSPASYHFSTTSTESQQLVKMDFPHSQLQASIAARVYLTTGVPSIYGQPTRRDGSSDGESSTRQHSLKSSSSLRNLGSLFGRSRSSAAGSTTQLASVASTDRENDDTSITTERYHEPVIFEDETEAHESVAEGETRQQIHFQAAPHYQDDDRRNHQGLFGRRHRTTVGMHGQDQVECPQVSIPDGSTTFGRSTKVKATTTIDGASMYGADFDVTAALKSLEANEAKGTSEQTNPKEVSNRLYHHQRQPSLYVTLSSNDLERLTEELYDQTIADVHLSLFIFWINTSSENYDVARKYIRELSCDKGYNPNRLTNPCLRYLLTETKSARPEYVHPKHHHYHNATLTTTSFHRTTSLSGLKIWIHLDTETDHLCISSEPHVIYDGEVSRAERAVDPLAGGRRGRLNPAVPRVDTLPPALRELKEKRSQAALRSASMATLAAASSSTRSRYPPDTPDRPLPLAPRSASSAFLPPIPSSSPIPPVPQLPPIHRSTSSGLLSIWPSSPCPRPRPLPSLPRSTSTSTALRCPSATMLSSPPASSPPAMPAPLPFGFPAPGSAVSGINDNMSALDEYDASSETELDEADEFRSRLASIYERMVVIQGPEELDAVMEELRTLRELWAPRRV